MSNNPNAATNQALTGIRVLVGRARHQAGALSSELRKRGAEVIEIPFIEIRKPRSFGPLDAALKNLASYDWLILTSVNGVEAMWERMPESREGQDFSAEKLSRSLRIAAIGPATKKAIEQRGWKVNIVHKHYVAESVVSSLKKKVKGKRILLVRAKVARDVIPRELRKSGAHVDVVEAYETVVPQASRARLRAILKKSSKRPHVVTFTSSSTVRNFVELLGSRSVASAGLASRGRGRPRHTGLEGMQMASIGPVTSSTMREYGLAVDIVAREFTIPGLVAAIVKKFARQ
jgi:uroporphyrinogen-III synthase